MNTDDNEYVIAISSSSHSDYKDTSVIWMWSVYAGLSGLITVSVSLVLAGLLHQYRYSNPRKKNPFNLYVVFLLIPNLLFGLFCTITCLVYLFSTSGTEGWCRFQSFYRLFDVTSNAWLLSVALQHIYELLQAVSQRRLSAALRKRSTARLQITGSMLSDEGEAAASDPQIVLSSSLRTPELPRYFGYYPNRKTVLSQTLGVFAWALFWSLLPMLPSLEWVPVSVHGDNSTDVQDVIMCLPSINHESATVDDSPPLQTTNETITDQDEDAITTITSNRYVFFYIFYLPGVALFPILYFGFILFKIWRKKFMSHVDEETKLLALYFIRLVLAFSIIWIPAILLLFVLSSSSGDTSNRWMFWTGGLLSHFMPLITVLLTVMSNEGLGNTIVKHVICRNPPPQRDSSTTESNEGGVALDSDEEQATSPIALPLPQQQSYRERISEALHDINNFIYDEEDDLQKPHEVDEEVRTYVTYDDIEEDAILSGMDSGSISPSCASSSSSEDEQQVLCAPEEPALPPLHPPRSSSNGSFHYNPSEHNSSSSRQYDEFPVRKLT